MQTKIQDQKDVPHLTDPMLLGVWVWVFSLTDLFYFDKDFYILGARGWGLGGGVCVWRLSIFWTGGRIDGLLKPSCDLGFVPNWKHWCSWRKVFSSNFRPSLHSFVDSPKLHMYNYTHAHCKITQSEFVPLQSWLPYKFSATSLCQVLTITRAHAKHLCAVTLWHKGHICENSKLLN